MNTEKLRLKHSLIFPLFFLITIWIIKIIEFILDISFAKYGIYPLKLSGLIGIITAPLIHGDFAHLISNSSSFFVLSIGLFYFYRKYAYRIFVMIYILEGIILWLTGRPSYHIGASGLVYGLAFFLFFSGILSKQKSLIAISLLVAFLYGSMIWGIFPTQSHISWESHLIGGLLGVLFAAFYSNKVQVEHKITDKKAVKKEKCQNFDFSNQVSTYHTLDINYIYKKSSY